MSASSGGGSHTLATFLLLACSGCGRIGYDSNDTAVADCAGVATGHCYALVLEPAAWDVARAICVSSLGATAHLVTIQGPAENVAVLPFARSIPYPPTETNPNQRQRRWMGATDIASIGTWERITFEPFDYANWRPGEPGSPGVDSRGARWVDDLKQTLPRPPAPPRASTTV